MRENHICVAHEHPLIPLWEKKRPDERYDLSSGFEHILEDVLAGELDRPRVKPSAYDIWLDTRLATGADDTWLAGQSLYAATTFCRLLGAELLRLEPPSSHDDESQYRKAHDLGFEFACQGEEAIICALNKLSANANGYNDEPQKAFGQLYSDLSQAHLDKTDFTTFRQLLRDRVIDNWPVTAGANILGHVQPKRKLYSIVTAAKEASVGAPLLKQILLHEGVISADDDRPNSRITFDAEKFSGLIEEVSMLVGSKKMQAAMGITKRQFNSLVEGGVLVPRFKSASIRFPWRLSDGLGLVAELQKKALPITEADPQWEEIYQAKSRTDLGTEVTLSMVFNDKISLGQRSNIEGYAAYVVLKAEIDHLVREQQTPAERDLITAAAFGRQVGVRTQGWFERLALADHTPATFKQNLKSNTHRVYVSPEDAESFHKRFFTPATIESQFSQNRRILLKKLRAAGVEVFSANGAKHESLYLRDEVEAVIT